MKGLIFTFALTYGGAVVSLFNPFYGLVIYIAFAILRPTSLWSYSVPQGGNYSRIIAIALLIGWAINGFGKWNLGRSRNIVYCLVGFMIWMTIAAITAVNPDAAFVRVEALLKVVIPFVVGMTTINSLRQINILCWVIIVCEGYLAYRFNSEYYAGVYHPDNPFRFADLDNNGVAITMVASAGLAFFCGLRELVLWRRGLAFVLAALMAHVVLFSNSRGGMLALIITAAATFVLIRKQPSHYVYFVVALLIGFRLAGPPVIERFSTIFVAVEERDASGAGRLELSKTMIQIMADHPITGVGAGNFMLVSHDYGWPPNKDGHTTWLQVGAENGIPGGILYLSFYVLTIAHCWSLTRARSRTPDAFADIGRMAIASLIGFMVSAQFVTVYGVELPYYVILLGACAVKLAGRESHAERIAVLEPWRAERFLSRRAEANPMHV